MLQLYRNHNKDYPHKDEGRRYVRCKCTIWVDGSLNRRRFNQSLKTRNWQKASELTDEQKRFLKEALTAYEDFARDAGEDEESRAGVARAYLGVGNIRLKLAQPTDAAVAYQSSALLYAHLATEFPRVPEYRRGVAASQNNRGLVLEITGQAKEAEAAYRAALAIHEQLAAEFPAGLLVGGAARDPLQHVALARGEPFATRKVGVENAVAAADVLPGLDRRWLLYTSDAADDLLRVDLCGSRLH